MVATVCKLGCGEAGGGGISATPEKIERTKTNIEHDDGVWHFPISNDDGASGANSAHSIQIFNLSPTFKPVLISIMLRTASNRIISQNAIAKRAFSSAVSQSSAGAPSVMDSIVKLNFVDPGGARRSVPAYVGKFCFVEIPAKDFVHFVFYCMVSSLSSPTLFFLLSLLLSRQISVRNMRNERNRSRTSIRRRFGRSSPLGHMDRAPLWRRPNYRIRPCPSRRKWC